MIVAYSMTLRLEQTLESSDRRSKTENTVRALLLHAVKPLGLPRCSSFHPKSQDLQPTSLNTVGFRAYRVEDFSVFDLEPLTVTAQEMSSVRAQVGSGKRSRDRQRNRAISTE